MPNALFRHYPTFPKSRSLSPIFQGTQSLVEHSCWEIRVLYRWRHDGKSAAKQGTCRKRYNDLKEARRRALEVYAVCIRRADGGKTATRGLRRTENAWSGPNRVLIRRANVRFLPCERRLKRAESSVKVGPGARVRCAPKRESGSRGDATWHHAAARAGGARVRSWAAVKRSTMSKRPPQRGQSQPLRAGSESE